MGGDLNEKVKPVQPYHRCAWQTCRRSHGAGGKIPGRSIVTEYERNKYFARQRKWHSTQSNPRNVEQAKSVHHFEDAPAESGGHGITRVSLR